MVCSRADDLATALNFEMFWEIISRKNESCSKREKYLISYKDYHQRHFRILALSFSIFLNFTENKKKQALCLCIGLNVCVLSDSCVDVQCSIA